MNMSAPLCIGMRRFLNYVVRHSHIYLTDTKYVHKTAGLGALNNALRSSCLQQNHVSATSFTWRTHSCGELRAANVGEHVVLSGWLQHQRLGLFATLRDSHGTTQLVVPQKNDTARDTSLKQLFSLSLESVITVHGVVRARPLAQQNKGMLTGDIEVEVKKVEVLNKCKPNPPFQLVDHLPAKEALRMQYRYFDLRREAMQRRLRARSDMTMKLREFLCTIHRFVDIETPTLFRRTPGGAREFLVPTEHPGKFYSLPQSPQQFKQLLMVGGMDRYMQIARCYRDEGARPDRQPEFTQVDIEMSFVSQNDILQLVEEMLKYAWPSHLKPIEIPFNRMTYEEAIGSYGTDKPDTRFNMRIHSLTDGLNSSNVVQNHAAHALNIKQGSEYFSKRELDKLASTLKDEFPVKHFFVIKVDDDLNWQSSLQAAFSGEQQMAANVKLEAKPGDILLLSVGDTFNACSFLGKIRLTCLDKLRQISDVFIDNNSFNFSWITDFPLFFPADGPEGCLETGHHPFTAPLPKDLHLVYSNPVKARGQHYDLVLNGQEIGGGSIRIHDADLQRYILDSVLKIDSAQMSHLLEALELGCPPHGGIALGLDRLIAIICGCKSIRDVIAFPKTVDGKCSMSGAPSALSDEELLHYHIRSVT